MKPYMKCKFCGKDTAGMITVWGKGSFPICGDGICREKATDGM